MNQEDDETEMVKYRVDQLFPGGVQSVRPNPKQKDIVYMPIFTITVVVILISVFIISQIDKGRYGINKKGSLYVPCMKPAGHQTRTLVIVCDLAEKCTYDELLKSMCSHFLYPYQLYRFITAMFLHMNLLHFLVNTLNIILCGITVERKFGSVKTLIVYFVSSFTAMLMHAVLFNQSLGLGASGASYGLLVVVIVDRLGTLSKANRLRILIEILFYFSVLNIPYIVMSFFYQINHEAHVASALVGLLLGIVLSEYAAISRQLRYVSIFLIVVIFTALIITFFATNAPHLKWIENALLTNESLVSVVD
ncbi:unnamed protein product [Didymodactylos carnosus]|uniref:rhomboid protease n=1 Tax=Didymodactylos carnosus TaxID=1234261 RepID=A0A814SUQ5_9BILA|nr:unnamed protein product [Didymodactylos carnosus]CAF3916586.1 unnamed protein product [Didymodactylos carnosus]